MVDAMRWLERRMALKTESPRLGETTRRAALVLGGTLMTAGASAAGGTAFDFTMEAIEGGPLDLGTFRGRPMLVVNTASFCGFTPQYKGLEALYSKYKDRGLVVLGFPSNDFSQEPENNAKIADFCESTYGVKFPMFVKTTVRGSDALPLFKQLAQITGTTPKWNFYKYIISRDGTRITSYGSVSSPEGKDFLNEVEKQIKAGGGT